MHVATRYLEAVAAWDWTAAKACLAEDVRRVGPFGDTYTARNEYLDFLQKLMPSLSGYRMDLRRLIVSEDGRAAVVELCETVEMDGRAVVTPESLVFDLDSEGLIASIRIYIQQA